MLDAFPVEAVYLSGDTKGTSTAGTFLRSVRDDDAGVFEVRAGMQMDWGGTEVTALLREHPAT